MGRKPTGRKFDKIVTVRVTEQEREYFIKLCKENNVKAQDILRECILGYIKKKGEKDWLQDNN